MSRPTLLRSLVGLALLVPWTTLVADDHLVIERTRSYMGTTSPKRTSEIWLGDSAVCIKGGRVSTILRFDLEKSWTVSPGRNRYFEEPLKPPEGDPSPAKRDTNMHTFGFDYEPEYDWIVDTTDRRDSINGMLCRHVVASGDADFAERTVDLWITQDTPIRLGRYFKKCLRYTLGPDWKGLYRAFGELREYLIVRSLETAEPAIAPTIILESRIARAEVATPPDRTYELPAGCTKVDSSDELYR